MLCPDQLSLIDSLVATDNSLCLCSEWLLTCQGGHSRAKICPSEFTAHRGSCVEGTFGIYDSNWGPDSASDGPLLLIASSVQHEALLVGS